MLTIIFNQAGQAVSVSGALDLRLRRIPFEVFDDDQIGMSRRGGHGGFGGFGRLHIPALYALMQQEWSRNGVARLQREELITNRLVREAAQVQLFKQMQENHLKKSIATVLLLELA